VDLLFAGYLKKGIGSFDVRRCVTQRVVMIRFADFGRVCMLSFGGN